MEGPLGEYRVVSFFHHDCHFCASKTTAAHLAAGIIAVRMNLTSRVLHHIVRSSFAPSPASDTTRRSIRFAFIHSDTSF